MRNLLLTILLLPSLVFGAAAITSSGAYKLNRASKLDRDLASGTKLLDATQMGVKAQWDYSVSGGAASSDITLLDHEGRPVTLPAGAIITDCLIDVVTQPDSSTDSVKLAFSSSAVADLKAAAFPTTYVTTSRIACIPEGTEANMIKMASEATLKMRVGSEAATAGKINIWVEYVLSE